MTWQYWNIIGFDADNMLYRRYHIFATMALEAHISGAVYSLYATLAKV